MAATAERAYHYNDFASMPTLKRGGAQLPLYHQLKTAILGDIQGGCWKPGDRLPTEDALIARFHVSKITVRQALRDLAAMGYIRRAQGRGTFVLHPPLEEGPRELTSFTGEMRGHGRVATSRVIEQEVVEAPGDIASRLDIAPGAPVFRLQRLRLADGEPMGLQTAYIPAALVPGIDRNCRSWTRRSTRCCRRATRCGPPPPAKRTARWASPRRPPCCCRSRPERRRFPRNA